MNFVTCALCYKKFRRITYNHLKSKHSMTIEQYRTIFPNAEWGEHHSEMTKKKIGLSLLGKNKGKPSPMKGKVYGEAVRKKVSERTKLAMARPEVKLKIV